MRRAATELLDNTARARRSCLSPAYDEMRVGGGSVPVGESVLIIEFMIASACTKEQEDEDDCRDVGGAVNDDVHWLARGVDREGRETT